MRVLDQQGRLHSFKGISMADLDSAPVLPNAQDRDVQESGDVEDGVSSEEFGIRKDVNILINATI